MIENSLSSGNSAQKMQKNPGDHTFHSCRGRKSKYESRASEFRRKLAVWRQMPEGSRPSLRALARELGTSHQMLAYLLKRLEEWEHKENSRRERQHALGIRTRAKAENRQTTTWEEQQIQLHERASLRSFLEFGLLGVLKHWGRELAQAAKDGKPPAPEAKKLLRIFASRGNQTAQAIIEKYWPIKPNGQENNLPAVSCRRPKSFRTIEDGRGNSAGAEGGDAHAFAL